MGHFVALGWKWAAIAAVIGIIFWWYAPKAKDFDRIMPKPKDPEKDREGE